MNGVIKEIHSNIGATFLTLDNNGIEYMFMTIENSVTPSFSHFAVPGDSVYKPAYSDTIILNKKNGKTYKYLYHQI